MYTRNFSHRHIARHILREKYPEGVDYDSLRDSQNISSESRAKIQEFTERVIGNFEQNPEKKNDFLQSLDGMKESVFKDPILFRVFLSRAYERHALNIEKLTGGERLKKIQEFSVFITDVMYQFADMNNIPRLKSAIEAQKKALEIKENAVRTIQATHLASIATSTPA